MLVLSRKVGQELVIGDNIRITVNRVSGSRVTLGIVAPDAVRVIRGELEPVLRSFEIDVESDGQPPAAPGSRSLGLNWIVETPPNLADLGREVH